MRTAASTRTTRMTLTVLVGGLALAIAGASCKQTGPTSSSGSGGSGSGGNSSSGGSGSGGTSSSGGSSASGGSASGGTTSSGGSNAGGSSASGGSNAGGSSASGGSNDTGGSNSGGSNSGGSSGNGGSGDTGGSNSGGSNSGGSSGNGGSSDTGGSASGGSGGEGGSASGGSSNSGGSTGSGGATETGGSSGTGGSSQGVLNCASPLTPSDGLVTDFSDYSTSTGKWGSTSGLYGAVFGYPGANGSTMTGTVDNTAKNLHLVGTVNAGDYAGGGLSFYACATADSYTKVSFSLTGSFGGTASTCDLELQIQTFDQRPTTQTPPGGCSGSCYNYPVAKKIGTPSSTASTITLPLADFTNWSTANAKQVVGLQWQVTVPTASTTGDAALPSCAADFTVDDIKFQ